VWTAFRIEGGWLSEHLYSRVSST
jgi:Rps23 Pro-64 3,4-dihydroxylase Tpa1-like proline 4-hydroxylase